MKEEKCKYCEMEETIAKEWLATRDEEFGRMIISLDLILVEDKGQPAIGITLGDFIDETIPINFCPMCGRKLNPAAVDSPELRERFKKSLERLMNAKSESSNDVCKAIGVPPTTFSNWKTGTTFPRAEKLEKLAQHFGVEVKELM